MSTAAAVEGAAPVKKAGKKKLVIIAAAALVLLLLLGAGGVLLLKQRQAAADDEGAVAAKGEAKAQRRDPSAVPVFVPLDSFTINLADREVDRYAQIGMALELNDAHEAERIKQYMPAIRNNILMVLSNKRSSDLLERSGKEQLAAEVKRETERALGVEPGAKGAHPVRAVQFSNFIIQ